MFVLTEIESTGQFHCFNQRENTWEKLLSHIMGAVDAAGWAGNNLRLQLGTILLHLYETCSFGVCKFPRETIPCSSVRQPPWAAGKRPGTDPAAGAGGGRPPSISSGPVRLCPGRTPPFSAACDAFPPCPAARRRRALGPRGRRGGGGRVEGLPPAPRPPAVPGAAGQAMKGPRAPAMFGAGRYSIPRPVTRNLEDLDSVQSVLLHRSVPATGRRLRRGRSPQPGWDPPAGSSPGGGAGSAARGAAASPPGSPGRLPRGSLLLWRQEGRGAVVPASPPSPSPGAGGVRAGEAPCRAVPCPPPLPRWSREGQGAAARGAAARPRASRLP